METIHKVLVAGVTGAIGLSLWFAVGAGSHSSSSNTKLTTPSSLPAGSAAGDAQPRRANVGGIHGVAGSGAITGRVLLSAAPLPAPRQVANAAAAACVPGAPPVMDESIVLGDAQGPTVAALQNVFVFIDPLSPALEGKIFPPAKSVAELHQKNCAFVPHVLGVMVQQTLRISNDENTLHNVNVNARVNPAMNIAQPARGVMNELKFQNAEVISIRCDIHPWMNATVHVMPHPYFAVTQQDGTFLIEGLPAGEYRVRFWHENSRIRPDKEMVEFRASAGRGVNLGDVIYSPTP